MDASGNTLIPLDDRAYQLHCRGYSLRQIGHELGIDKDTAQRYVATIRRDVAGAHRRNVKRWTDDAVERLREVQRAAWEHHSRSGGDVAALNTIAACEDRIAKLRGLFTSDEQHGQSLAIKVEFVNDWRK